MFHLKRTIIILGFSFVFHKKWTEFQYTGGKTVENQDAIGRSITHFHETHNLSNHLDGTQMEKCFLWIKYCPVLIDDNVSKGNKVVFWYYLLQEIKAYYFQTFLIKLVFIITFVEHRWSVFYQFATGIDHILE